jgi:hypothetical protein
MKIEIPSLLRGKYTDKIQPHLEISSEFPDTVIFQIVEPEPRRSGYVEVSLPALIQLLQGLQIQDEAECQRYNERYQGALQVQNDENFIVKSWIDSESE